MRGPPYVNATFEITIGNMPPNRFGAMVLGFSETVWAATGRALPFDLAGFGMPGCSLYVSPDIVVAFDTGPLSYRGFPINVPNRPALIGFQTWFQYFFADPDNPNPLPVSHTNAGRVTLGG